jgi:origin recognition complex subunit 5
MSVAPTASQSGATANPRRARPPTKMSPFLPPELHSLLSTCPCRDTQFGTLYSLLGHPNLPSPPSICLTGFPATGKRTVTRAFLDAVRVQYAWIDCAETVSSALLFYRVLHCLRKMVVETETEAGRVGGDINAFVVQVQKLMHQLQGKIVLVLAPILRLHLLYLIVY